MLRCNGPRRWSPACRACTAALQIVVDNETGELETATILKRFGEVPDALGDMLQAV